MHGVGVFRSAVYSFSFLPPLLSPYRPPPPRRCCCYCGNFEFSRECLHLPLSINQAPPLLSIWDLDIRALASSSSFTPRLAVWQFILTQMFTEQ
jgi:hypothetical protein